jgi:hypothetical protein
LNVFGKSDDRVECDVSPTVCKRSDRVERRTDLYYFGLVTINFALLALVYRHRPIDVVLHVIRPATHTFCLDSTD